MVMNISCQFEKTSYNIFFVRAVTGKSLYSLRWRCNKAKSIVSPGCYPVDTIKSHAILKYSQEIKKKINLIMLSLGV